MYVKLMSKVLRRIHIYMCILCRTFDANFYRVSSLITFGYTFQSVRRIANLSILVIAITGYADTYYGNCDYQAYWHVLLYPRFGMVCAESFKS